MLRGGEERGRRKREQEGGRSSFFPWNARKENGLVVVKPTFLSFSFSFLSNDLLP